MPPSPHRIWEAPCGQCCLTHPPYRQDSSPSGCTFLPAFRWGQAASSRSVSPLDWTQGCDHHHDGWGEGSDTLADRLRRRSEGSGPAAAKVQPVPGGPCQPELFLEAMFANFVLIVSLSKLWLPGLRERESEKPSLLVLLLL